MFSQDKGSVSNSTRKFEICVSRKVCDWCHEFTTRAYLAKGVEVCFRLKEDGERQIPSLFLKVLVDSKVAEIEKVRGAVLSKFGRKSSKVQDR